MKFAELRTGQSSDAKPFDSLASLAAFDLEATSLFDLPTPEMR